MFDKLPEYGHRIDNNTKHIAVLDEDGGVHTMFGMGGGIFLEQAYRAGGLVEFCDSETKNFGKGCSKFIFSVNPKNIIFCPVSHQFILLVFLLFL